MEPLQKPMDYCVDIKKWLQEVSNQRQDLEFLSF
jgi:hypothetical protein